MTDTILPVPLPAKKIEDIAFAVLRAFDDDKLWRALTYEHGPYDINTPTLALECLAQAFYAEGARACMAPLQEENAKLKTVMIAAAEEIHAHWDAHCDAEGYGPQNLQRRLEEGIPSEYGYTAGAFKALQERADALQAFKDAAMRMASSLADGEWAEHVSSDPDATELESRITELHNEITEQRERADALEEALSHFAAIDLKRADVPADFAWHVLNARSLINPTGGES